jgi:hypothetical protein
MKSTLSTVCLRLASKQGAVLALAIVGSIMAAGFFDGAG